MEFTSNASSQFEKLPTFLKWLRTQESQIQGTCKIVTKIWFPSKFPNFSLDTESYRLRVPITEDNELELTDLFESSIHEEKVLAIYVVDKKEAKFTIKDLEGEKGVWEELGGTGYVCTVQDRPKGRKRTPRKPVGEG